MSKDGEDVINYQEQNSTAFSFVFNLINGSFVKDNIMDDSTNAKRAYFFVYAGRFAILLAIFALFSAWITQLTATSILGMNQQHFFNDAITLVLIGIAFLLDSMIHIKGL